MEKKKIYYTDEINEDYALLKIDTKKVDGSYKYEHGNAFWKLGAFILYYIVAIPLVWLFEKIVLGVRFVNKGAVKKLKNGCFLYGNHVGFYDAFTPNLISVPRRNMILVGPDTVSIKGLRTVVEMLGAVPIPTGFSGMKSFLKAVEGHHIKGRNITVYPEAHIWPYFTGVRNFSDRSFSYPVKLGAPVVAFFTAYSKPKGIFSFLRKANVTVYVSEPFYADDNLTDKENQKMLRDKVYNFMLEKSGYSDYSVIEYIKTEKTEETAMV